MSDLPQADDEVQLHFIARKSADFKTVFKSIPKSYSSFFNAPFKNTFFFMLLILLNAIMGSVTYYVMNRNDEGWGVIALIFLISIISFLLYGLVYVKDKPKGKVKFSDYFAGFKTLQLEQIFILVLPTIYLFILNLVLHYSTLFEMISNAMAYGRDSDIAWLVMIFWPLLSVYLFAMFTYFSSLSLLVRSNAEGKNIDIFDIIIAPFKAFKSNYWVLTICTFFLLLLSIPLALFPPLLIITFFALMAFFDFIGKEIFFFTDQPDEDNNEKKEEKKMGVRVY